MSDSAVDAIMQATEPQMEALISVLAERHRQERLKAAGKFSHTCADNELSDDACCRVLGEEFGEVCRALNDGEDPSALRAELIQVAAVAVAWVERIDRGDKGL
jgi:hypothetical protein